MTKNALQIDKLNVHYGRAHILQEATLAVPDNSILAVVGRNGMGKTTLCNAIVGIIPSTSGAITVNDTNILGLSIDKIANLGVGYVPQGRHIWQSLTVDEHLSLAQSKNKKWTVERVYETFPKLKERRNNGGNQLSGGEQQMLAISRALLGNPNLLIMDEPTEGLAPIIVTQVEKLLLSLVAEGGLSILLIEQNLGVAMRVSKRIAIMRNGRIEVELDTKELAADKALQQKLLGVSAKKNDEPVKIEKTTNDTIKTKINYQADALINLSESPNIFSYGNPLIPKKSVKNNYITANKIITKWNDTTIVATKNIYDNAKLLTLYVVGTFDTKQRELFFVCDILTKQNLKVITVDVSTSNYSSPAKITPKMIARKHPNGMDAVFTGDRGTAVSAMAIAFKHYLLTQNDLAGIIGLGGSGGTALITPAMQTLEIGVPKFMVSTVASGDVSAYVGACDICMMYSVTDVAGINKISQIVLSNAAHALAGMVLNKQAKTKHSKPAIGLTMFGVTTPCVQAVSAKLEDKFDCLIFHATGAGGRSMEKLAESGLFSGLLDISTTEICDLIVGGVMSADKSRLDVVAKTKIPYIGSCGGLDMVNFGAIDSVPDKFKDRLLYKHNAQVTLMRTTPEENTLIGQWIGNKLNNCDGEVRFFIPEYGVSMLDAKGQPFFDQEANKALFQALENTINQNSSRQLIKLPYHINDVAFSDALVAEFNHLVKQ